MFPTGWGEPIHPDTVSSLMTVLINPQNDPQGGAKPDDPLPHARLHDLRHIHATTLQGRGVVSDASFPGLCEDGAVRDTEPCLPAAACSAWRENAGQHGHVGTRLRRTPRCGISFCNAA